MHNVSKFMVSCTAGAVPIRNEKGQMTMERVKVSRYIKGKRPHYARDTDSDSDTEDESTEVYDRRLNRLQTVEVKGEDDEDNEKMKTVKHRRDVEVTNYNDVEDKIKIKDEEYNEDDISDDEIQRRRELLKNMARMKEEESGMDVVEENSNEEELEEESEYEEDSESEDDFGGDERPRLKPVFIKKENRVTLIEQENNGILFENLETKLIKERREESLRILEEQKQREIEKMQEVKDLLEDVNTDDEDEKQGYLDWVEREAGRLKRDKDERDENEKNKMEIERVRNLTEEERIKERQLNPKFITNKAERGKMKFQQKYYHRGAFYLDEESDILKRNFNVATSGDLVDKTTLPACMQVKNFGRAGRSKYTHLVDQDTSKSDSHWSSNTLSNRNFYEKKGVV